MTAARKYDIADFRLDNWGRAMRRWQDPGLGFPKVSVYAKEYQSGAGDVWDNPPPPPPDDEDAQRVEEDLQAIKNEGAWGYKLYMVAKIKYHDAGGNNSDEDVQRHLSKALGRRVEMETVAELLAEVRMRINRA